MSKWTDQATWVGTDHHGGSMDSHRGLVVHIAEGFYAGTIAWQRNAPAGQRVSSHFIVGRDGRCAQMVDTDEQAWAQRSGNPDWLSVECEGFTTGHPLHKTHPGWESLSLQQIEKIAHLLVKAHQQYGVPIQVATGPDGRGLGHHSMGGVPWGHLDCPGLPIIGQKPAIVARAHQLAGDVQRPHPPTLKQGATGTTVAHLQALLNGVPNTGADVTVDGVFGPMTEAKVKRVQAHFKIAADGIVGPITWGKLGVH